MWKPWRNFDWNLRVCGTRGHITYRPDEPELAERLVAATSLGETWRCLRCGSFVLGAPHGSGPANQAPLVLRGEALRDAVILRFFAVERLVRGLLFFAFAYGVKAFNDARGGLTRVFDTYLPLLAPFFDRIGVELESTGPVKLIAKFMSTAHGTLTWVAIGLAAYGLLNCVEFVGLWRFKRWGEYVAVVATSFFVPLEIYELVHKVTWVKVAILVLNLALVAYLIWTKRLFGVRGGHEAFVEEQQQASLLEVETASIKADLHRLGRTSRHPG